MAKKEEISMKNTKGEILEALNAALKREKERNSEKSDPVKEETTKKAKEAIEESKKSVQNNVFSPELNDKFNKLELAIKTEEEKLEELYSIEKELYNLTLVTNTAKDFIASLEDKKKALENDYKLKNEDLEKEYSDKKKNLAKEYDDEQAELKKTRDREKEEYDYKLKRDREIDNNKWLDEKKKREEELSLKETSFKEREKELKEKEDHIKELETINASIPTELEKEYNRGKKEKEAELAKEYKYEKELASKDFQNTIDRQNDKIASLTEELNMLREENKSIQARLDNSYKEIKDMAAKTVEATGGLKILNNQSKENI